MKLKNTDVAETQGSSDIESKSFEISSEHSLHIFRMLTDYSDAIGSVVREITTNCFDAHRKADVDRDVVIKMNRESKLGGTSREIQFIDFGTGLSPKQVREVFTVLGESTKRDNNEAMGAFGIGAKSPFGYIRNKDLGAYKVDTYVDGIHYEYILYEEKEGPKMDKIHEEETDRTNGTVVTVPIADGDWYTFKRKVRSELAYFDNLQFKGDVDISDDYTIYRGENFVYRPDSNPYDKVHACFGKVAYPLDYNELDWNNGRDTRNYNAPRKYGVPIALYFDIGEIEVVPNREQIKYTDETVEVIQKRLEEAREEFQEMWDKSNTGVKTIADLREARNERSDYKISTDVVDIPYSKGLLPDDRIELEDFDFKPPKDLFYNYETHKVISEGYVDSNRNVSSVKTLIDDGYKDGYLLDGTSYSPKKNRYISSRFGEGLSKFYLVKKKRWSLNPLSTPLFNDSDIDLVYDIDNPDLERAKVRFVQKWNNVGWDDVEDMSDDEVKERIRFEELVSDYVEDKLEDYTEVEVSDDFEEWEKKKREQEKEDKEDDGTFPIKIIEKSSSYGENYKWKMDDMDKENLDDNTLYIYGFSEHDNKLLSIAPIIYANDNFYSDGRYYSQKLDRNKVAVLKIAMSREYLFEDLDNAYHIDDFIGEHKVYKRAIHASYLKAELESKDYIDLMSKYYPELASKVKEVFQYANQYGTAKREMSYCDHYKENKEKYSDWKYNGEYIQNLYKAFKQQLPLLKDVGRKFNKKEFDIYVQAKKLINPKLYLKLYNVE